MVYVGGGCVSREGVGRGCTYVRIMCRVHEVGAWGSEKSGVEWEGEEPVVVRAAVGDRTGAEGL